ncbi:phosphotyrosine protein [Wolfiporia cocos MD-104 SS10]|uniref:Phosphotyrosine protein n=1 Tax=Wolfiporia cocos (strain MD-104) TaxID=742152 RepID=A0A2H3J786_WOLCO|nr:phosphotyrosine protein [Wolfiporia cocos MD-104 SS10]
MDAIRVAKVEGVLCTKAGITTSGTIHLTAHHLIFHHDDPEREETWVPYPLISLVTRLPLTLQGQCPLTIRTRTFEALNLMFATERDAIDVFDSVKELTVATSVTQLYAFYYVPNPPFDVQNGWSLYSPREEFGRMGVGSRTKAWRFTDINKDYSFSPTYPARLVVPTRISDTTLQYAVKYRSKGRLPALTYLHWANYGSITRSSQPMVGLTSNRSIQDEKLIEAVFQTHWSPESRASNAPVYGATTTNLIIDARPTTNAVANTAKGAGTENMDHYKEAKKAYLGIDNIHVMRDSLARVVDTLREADLLAATNSGMSDEQADEGTATPVLDRQALRRSGWLKHISAIMEGSLLIVRNVHVNSSHVLIHCSDGWDRTAQLSALSQLCLDPFYRTIRGFMILVEKDWVSFGHRFLDRCGHLSSDKFFLAPTENPGGGGGAEAAQAFLASVQNRFASQSHIKETSPVFHQWLECVWQVQRQFPERFEFNERFLLQLHYHLYSCQFGSFLFNTERERRVGEGGPPPCDRTVSVWDFFNSPPELELNRNPDYDPSMDDPANRSSKADMGVLMFNPKDVRFWYQLYGRTDEEMNGRFVARQAAENPEFAGPIGASADDLVNIPASHRKRSLGALMKGALRRRLNHRRSGHL